MEELQDVIAKEWAATSPEFLRKLARSMPERCQAVIDAKGDHTVLKTISVQGCTYGIRLPVNDSLEMTLMRRIKKTAWNGPTKLLSPALLIRYPIRSHFFLVKSIVHA